GGNLPSPTGFATGKLLAVIDARGETTQYTYQVGPGSGSGFGPGDLKAVTDPRGYTTNYASYDAYGNGTENDHPQGPNGTHRTFDVRSRLLNKYDTFGHHVEYQYDGLDHMIRETQYDGANPSANTGTNRYQLPGDGSRAPWAEETLYTYTPNGEVLTMTDG